jgi:hypothetical protein
MLQCGAAGEGDGARGRRREPDRREPLPDRPARELLHDDQAQRAALDVVVHRHDVRVGERRQGPGLGGEAVPDVGLAGERLRQFLDRDGAAQAAVVRAEHNAHAAAAELALDFVIRKRLRDAREIVSHCACRQSPESRSAAH